MSPVVSGGGGRSTSYPTNCESHYLQPTNERESEDATAYVGERDGPQLPQVSETAKRERRFFSEYAATYKSKTEILTSPGRK
jgi:hypothetical protein